MSHQNQCSKFMIVMKIMFFNLDEDDDEALNFYSQIYFRETRTSWGRYQRHEYFYCEGVVDFTNIMRYGIHYVHAAKCLLDPKYNQNPNQTVWNRIRTLKWHHTTACDAYTKRLKSHYAVCIGHEQSLCYELRNPAFELKRVFFLQNFEEMASDVLSYVAKSQVSEMSE